MSKWPVELLQVSSLEVNPENPRFELASDQREAISAMLSDQGPKIFNLAQDIVTNGLNPSDIAIVSRHATEKGRFVVLEGNRRVTALKLLVNPELASSKHQGLLNKFKQLGKENKETDLKRIFCVIVDTPEDAKKWIQLKHTGENDGVGTVRWDTQQIARFEARAGGSSRIALQVIDFLSKSDQVDDDLKERLPLVPLTNLDRLITDRNIQDVLGISIADGRLQADVKESELVKGLVKIVEDLVSKKVKVRDIYTKKHREDYIETFKKKEIPQKSEKAEAAWELIGVQKSAQPAARTKRSIPPSTDRKYLIRKDCVLEIRDTRVNKTYHELKRLDCNEFPNAAAVLLRVFLELSSDAYIAKHKLPKMNADSKLFQKLSAIANDLETKEKATKGELKAIRTAVSSQDHIFSTNTFNAYVHNRNMNPIPKELKIAWDNIQAFVEALWGNA